MASKLLMPDQDEQLLQGMKEEESSTEAGSIAAAALARQAHTLQRGRWLTWGPVVALVPLEIVLGWLHPDNQVLQNTLLLVAGLGIILWGAWFQYQAAHQLAQWQDVRVVGPLVEAWEADANLRAVTIVLIHLLPRLQASEASLLSPRQRTYLNHMLEGKDVPLILAVLQALAQVGDSKALLNVSKLAAGGGAARNHSQVRQAAQWYLPFVQRRAEEERASQTLLRAATSDASSEVLLRPARKGGVTPPTQLLRPASEDSKEQGQGRW